MPLLKEENYTIEDIYALPEGERAELIDGQIYYMAPPSRKHQDISGELYVDIKGYIRSHGGDCKVYAAPFAVYLDEATNTYVEPDISVICDPDKLDDKGCTISSTAIWRSIHCRILLKRGFMRIASLILGVWIFKCKSRAAALIYGSSLSFFAACTPPDYIH